MFKLLKRVTGKKVNPSQSRPSKNPNQFTYKDTQPYRYHGKKLVYSNFARDLLKENPGIIKAINFLSRNKKEIRFVDKKGKFEILKVTKQIINQKRTTSTYTSEGYVLIINKVKPIRFFIKETRGVVEFSLTEELLALRSIEKEAKKVGFKIIKPHFAFDNYSQKKGFFYNPSNLKSFIAYELSYFLTVTDAINKKKLTLKDKKEINSKFSKLNQSLEKIGFKDLDLDKKNCFVDLSKKPVDLYLFDPLTYGENYSIFTKEIDKIERK